MTTKLEFITVESMLNSKPDYSVIWLHGLGADGHDFESIVPELNLSDKSIRFLFPHAPMRPVTINMGMRMRAWYDIKGTSLEDKQDAPGIKESSQAVVSLIEQEIALGIPSERIFLAGFSQGGAIAMYTGLTCAYPLAGVIALSTYLPLIDELKGYDKEGRTLNILDVLMAHGSLDDLVPQSLGEMALAELKAVGAKVDWRSYPMHHNVCMEEVRDISQWMRQRIK